MKLLHYYNPLNLKIIILTIFISISGFAQNTIINDKKNITKAVVLSAACPGLGQLYNKKYWKIPLIYTALSGTIYYYINHNNKYKEYQSAYISRINENTISNEPFPEYSNNNLITLKDYHRNSRDLAGLITILVYLLNIVDASVDAHLTNYNVNNNLSLSLDYDNGYTAIKLLNLTLKYTL